MVSKRSFYADDEDVITKPGFNSKITEELKEKESAHGNISFIEGMGIRTVPILEKYSNKFRLFLHDKLQLYSAELDTQKTAASNEWNTVKAQYNQVIAEPVLPSLIYILTASLTGSILVNRRSLPVRFITPLVFGGVAFNYFMPKSYNNAQNKLIGLEKSNYPDVYKQQNELIDQFNEYKKQFNQSLQQGEIELQKNIHETKGYLCDLLSDEKK